VVKNKIAPPFREVRFALLFDYGFDDVRSNLEWLLEQGKLDGVETPLQLNGAWYSWGEERLGPGLEKAILAVEDMEMVQELEREVVRVWRLVHRATKRKKKER